jgi:exopolyphosphatase/guanosine-5'-triphosphate,3'-diphosphate pyrophosphatase
LLDDGDVRTGRRRRRRQRRPLRVAALDLGTNNCRLLIAAPKRNGEMLIIDSFSRIVRLGEGVAATGELSTAAIERTIAALKVCAEHIRAKDVERVRAIATEACRRAANTSVLLERARKEAGIELSVITTDEEARLAAMGCAPLIDPKAEGALIFDIGGGSTEVIWMRRDPSGATHVIASQSEPVGVVALADLWKEKPSDLAGYVVMRDAMIERFRPIRAKMDAAGAFDPKTHHLLGTSGTVTTLAGIALGLDRYSRARVDASWHHCRDIVAVIDRLAGLDLAGRAALGCVGADRADLILPGSAIFAAILEHWPCTELRVADRGLREAMLRELIAGRSP